MGSATRVSLTILMLFATGCVHVQAQEPAGELLWQIGVPDGAGNEFALAPGGYGNYVHDGFFYVGASHPDRDWPYAHPGPLDMWSGGGRRPFTILFSLDAVAATGDCVLEVHTVDAHAASPPYVRFEINGKNFDHRTVAGAGDRSIQGDPSAGKPEHYTITFPVELLKSGENRITITSLSGSWFLYDSLALRASTGTTLAANPEPHSLIESVRPLPVRFGQDFQGVRVAVRHLGEPVSAEIEVAGGEPGAGQDAPLMNSFQHRRVEQLRHGLQTIDIRHPAVATPQTGTVRLAIAGDTVDEKEVALAPVRPWVIYMLHHTHLDIGYTHPQAEVERIQWQHLDTALDLIDQTRDYPAEAQFHWLPEGMWAIDSYLDQATEAQRERFINAIRSGHIGLDALYGNELTALCRPEELFELTQYARDFAAAHNLELDSAMISDVPGYTWGFVPALAQGGIRYLSPGPNASHRIGYTLSAWGDKPFWWVSPSGEEKVLVWMAGKAYSWFHSGPIAGDQKLLDYLVELEDAGYPYDMVHVRYNIGGDNGPPDPNLSDYVRDWNAKYEYPKLILATNSQMFSAFEQAYGDKVPEVRGDFTPYWEDGAASSALETILNRAAAERLVQAQTLYALLDPAGYSKEAFDAAWREIILYNEHTWGAHNSISQPESEFALTQWAYKQKFAIEADKQSRALLDAALQSVRQDGASPVERGGGDVSSSPFEGGRGDVPVQIVSVFNTLSWPRTDLVILPADWELPGDRVEGASGQPVPSQRLSGGSLAFLARDVPAFGEARYTVTAGDAHSAGTTSIQGNRLTSGEISVVINDTTGAIAGVTVSNEEFVDTSGEMGLNDYFYVAGRDPKEPKRNGAVAIRPGESGPLVSSLIITSDAPGCRALTREVRVIAGLDRVDIITNIDKENVYDPEGVHLAFPFNVPGGTVRMDTPWAVVRPEVDQIAGSCKNYFTVQRWVDVSNDARGITWATVDAPMIELGAITNDARLLGFMEKIEPTTTLYSYVMNNYWETNYKASQEGPTIFRYSLRPHGPYDQVQAQRFGIEQNQPLIAVPAKANAPAMARRLEVTPEAVIVTSVRPIDDGKAWQIRLFNTSEEPAEATLTRDSKPGDKISVNGYGIKTVRVK